VLLLPEDKSFAVVTKQRLAHRHACRRRYTNSSSPHHLGPILPHFDVMPHHQCHTAQDIMAYLACHELTSDLMPDSREQLVPAASECAAVLRHDAHVVQLIVQRDVDVLHRLEGWVAVTVQR
jgi:hypothetical protein